MSTYTDIGHIPVEHLRAAARAWRESASRSYWWNMQNMSPYDRIDEMVEEIACLREALAKANGSEP